MTTYSPSLRFWEGTPGDPAITNIWGAALNTNFTLIDSSITGLATVDLTGLTTYSLTANNGSADQSREVMQDYIGAIPGTCTVTIPSAQKIGWARNRTSGGFNVLLNAGAGADATIPPDSQWYFYHTTGGTVVVVSAAFQNLKTAGTLTVGGAANVGGLLTASAGAAVTGSMAVTGGNVTVGGVAAALVDQFAYPSNNAANIGSQIKMRMGITSVSDFFGNCTATYSPAFPTAALATLAIANDISNGYIVVLASSTAASATFRVFNASGAGQSGVSCTYWAIGA